MYIALSTVSCLSTQREAQALHKVLGSLSNAQLGAGPTVGRGPPQVYLGSATRAACSTCEA